MVAALISMIGHGPSVYAVHVPHVPPRTRKKMSRPKGGKTRRLVTHWSLPFRCEAPFQ